MTNRNQTKSVLLSSISHSSYFSVPKPFIQCGSSLFIAQELICLLDLIKILSSFWIIWILIWMLFESQFPVCLYTVHKQELIEHTIDANNCIKSYHSILNDKQTFLISVSLVDGPPSDRPRVSYAFSGALMLKRVSCIL
jgi:hypothetical protein